MPYGDEYNMYSIINVKIICFVYKPIFILLSIFLFIKITWHFDI